jgi:eukaryotic-like serine/threonine-protein kinase
MESPRIDGLRVTQTIGSGVTGTVYSAEDENATKVCVKVFQGMAIHRPLLQKMTLRLEEGGWPSGIMPILSANFEARPALRVTTDYRDDDGTPRSLQYLWNRDLPMSRWDIIRELAQALASMHTRQVAHGNLKPGNIFFGEDGEILLSDWTLGNMPGISHLDYTDALLYQPPEQLLHPEGYLEEKGYRWDVFAFACLSFRLLTGHFPRCDDTFTKVAPAFSDARRESIVADTQRIAASLEAEDIAPWPEAANDLREQDYRDLLLQCLQLSPHHRPASMVEVSRTFEEIDFRHDAAEHRESLLNARRRSRRISTLMTIISGVLLACFIVASLNWLRSKSLLADEKSARKQEAAALRDTADQSIAAKNHETNQRVKEVAAAQSAQKNAEQQLRSDRDQWIEKLRASRTVGDQLFDWALAKGHRTLPPLDSRESRLRQLQAFYQQFLRESALLPERPRQCRTSRRPPRNGTAGNPEIFAECRLATPHRVRPAHARALAP